MNVFTVIGIIGIGMVLLTMLITFTMLKLSQAVANVATELEEEKKSYRPAQTLGHKIALVDDAERQFQEARLEAAKRAAALPRGANMRIGRLGQANLKTASRNLENDPVSAFKIAKHQGWRGLGEFERYQAAATGATAAGPAPAAAAPRVKRKLVPGEDYAWIEITDDMDPAERRRARIANAKSKSAAMKELKAAGADTVAAPAAAPAGRPAAPAQPAQPTAADLGIEEPDLIEITDDMSPNEVRKARIANAKAKSAYKKALKAAGIDPSAPDAAQRAAAQQQQAAAQPAPAQPTAADVGIEEPDLIEITDDMGADEVRKARIANAKAMSAYKKALKAAGIDPSQATAKAAPQPQAAAAPQPQTAAAQPAASPPADVPPPPELIEITDDMSPDEVRQARISNARAKSAYKKELKAAGIDPKTVDV